ncbi:MAG: YqcI/YcgG family protein [Bacillus sp. (in: Bacteria)]|nr:YqcI/YcgG family protein [Bacillus sp. (in: firmicutes)]
MRLYTKTDINHTVLERWKKDAFEKFGEILADDQKLFPCIPATLGQKLNRFHYGFVSCPYEESSAKQLACLLEDYSKCYRVTEHYSSLIIFYELSLEISKNRSVEHYQQLFWGQLNQISELDHVEWPSHIPTDPYDPLWEFCFHGEQYFIYCATPSHKNRMSRYFPYFMLAITPRFVLESFHSAPSHAEKIKRKIRKRLADYDSILVHPDLNIYGQKDNFEWKQYFLPDDDTTPLKCPFNHNKKKTSKD